MLVEAAPRRPPTPVQWTTQVLSHESRREEGRRTERRLRLRRVRSNTLSATPNVSEHNDDKPVTDTSTEVEALRKRVAELEAKQDVNVLAQRVKHLETSSWQINHVLFSVWKGRPRSI